MASLELWEEIKKYLFSLPLNKSLPKLKIFLKSSNVVVQENTFSILVPNRMIKGLLVNEFMDSIVEAVRYVANRNFNVSIEVQSEFSVGRSANPGVPNGTAPAFSRGPAGLRMNDGRPAQAAGAGPDGQVYQPFPAGSSYGDLQEIDGTQVLPPGVISSEMRNGSRHPETEYGGYDRERFGDEAQTFHAEQPAPASAGAACTLDEFRNNIFYGSVTIQKDKNFDNFVEGPTNANLCTNGRLIASDPGNPDRNPFFIWGDSGLGKTHILNAIANEAARLYPEKKIILVTLEKFYQDFIRAVDEYRRKGGIASTTYNSFKTFYRNADVFLIDDIQQLENNVGITKEFISLFDEIVCSNVQLVFAASQLPSELRKLDSRIRNRIQSGVVIKVEPPDKATREKIIKAKIKEMNLDFDNQSVLFLANKFQTNIRVLEGHIKTIGAYVTGTAGADRRNFTVTVDVVKVALKDLLNAHAKLQTVDNIKQVVAEYYGITVRDIDSPARPANIAYARSMAMALARKLTGASYPSLGKQFGNKDHSTVLSACNKVKAKIDLHDPKYTEDWENLKLQLTD